MMYRLQNGITHAILLKIKGAVHYAGHLLQGLKHVSELIQKSKLDEIKEVMADNTDIGMRTFDQALYNLYCAGRIDLDNALRNADSRNDLSLKIRMSAEGPGQV